MPTTRVSEDDLDFDQDDYAYLNGVPFTGLLEERASDGTLRSEVPYEDGVAEGPAKEWRSDGTLAGLTTYHRGSKHGAEKEWYSDGRPKMESEWEYAICLWRTRYDIAPRHLLTWRKS